MFVRGNLMQYLQAVDEGALFWFENHSAPWLTALMKGFAYLGDRDVMLGLIFAVGVGYFLWKMPRTAAIVLLGALLAYLLSRGVKTIVHRPRPEVVWRRVPLPEEWSFPSGHALNSMADFGAIALTLSRRLRRRAVRRLVLATGFTLPICIGLCRPYLGVHYPSDVIGGWTAGLACALLIYWADLRWGERRGVVVPAMPAEQTSALHSHKSDPESVVAGGDVAEFTTPT
jgi:undecaprenyl-diphosphatase